MIRFRKRCLLFAFVLLQDDTSSRFDLTDLRRDVQTGVLNQKSINEYDAMTRAVLEKQVPAGFKRPEDTNSASDYVSSDGKTGYEKFIIDLVETTHDVEIQKRIHQYIDQELSNEGLLVDSLIYLFN